MAPHGFVITGPPVPCAECRTSFIPDITCGNGRSAVRVLCPPCRNKAKKAKARKKREET